MNTAEQL